MSITTLVISLVIAGAFAGLLAGLLGVGGGIVIVPVLFYLFTILDLDPSVRMPLAVGTSLCTIIVTAAVSSRAHWRRGSVDAELVRSFAPWLVVGVLIGAIIAGLAPTGVMLLVFASVALVVAMYMGLSPAGLTLAEGLPAGPFRWILATVIGGVSSIMGIGGGTLTVPILALANFPAQRAVGTGAAVGLIIAIPATIGMMIIGWGEPALPAGSVGYVNLLGFAVIVPLTALLAPVGANLAHRLSSVMLKRAFALFLLITSARMFMEWFGYV